MEFEKFPKIARYSKETVTITEKIDGTNAALVIKGGELKAQSRSRFIVPGDDNHGFAKWAYANADELIERLGDGRHFGEWWGQGIQRGYGLDHKVFSLFNTHRWAEIGTPGGWVGDAVLATVPVLVTDSIEALAEWVPDLLDRLYVLGSEAAPGFMNPEGLMLYFHELRTYLKAPFDPAPKTMTAAEFLADDSEVMAGVRVLL
jgi:hypothetical protein